jgi:hypothetical protein
MAFAASKPHQLDTHTNIYLFGHARKSCWNLRGGFNPSVIYFYHKDANVPFKPVVVFLDVPSYSIAVLLCSASSFWLFAETLVCELAINKLTKLVGLGWPR